MNATTRAALFQTVIAEGMLDFARATALCHLLMQNQHVYGDVCEFGTHKGCTAALLASLTKKKMWLYDSFEGLDEPGPNDGKHPHYARGSMRVPSCDCEERFDNLGLDKPTIVINEVKYLTFADLPPGIAFVHCDLDLYEPTKKVLQLVWPFMSTGAVMVLDDYGHPDLPGVKKAVDEFFLMTETRIVQPMGLNGEKSLHCYVTR